MKNLGIDELFLLSEIADKMDIEIPKMPHLNMEEIDKVDGNVEESELTAEQLEAREKRIKMAQDDIQKEYGMKLLLVVGKKAYKAKEEIKTLVGLIAEKDVNKMKFKEIVDVFKGLFKNNEVTEVFTSADK